MSAFIRVLALLKTGEVSKLTFLAQRGFFQQSVEGEGACPAPKHLVLVVILETQAVAVFEVRVRIVLMIFTQPCSSLMMDGQSSHS